MGSALRALATLRYFPGGKHAARPPLLVQNDRAPRLSTPMPLISFASAMDSGSWYRTRSICPDHRPMVACGVQPPPSTSGGSATAATMSVAAAAATANPLTTAMVAEWPALRHDSVGVVGHPMDLRKDAQGHGDAHNSWSRRSGAQKLGRGWRWE